jgi:hypothetical protein
MMVDGDGEGRRGHMFAGAAVHPHPPRGWQEGFREATPPVRLYTRAVCLRAIRSDFKPRNYINL